MDAEERQSNIRSEIATGAMRTMEAIDDEFMEAAERVTDDIDTFVRVMGDKGMDRDSVLAFLLCFVTRAVVDTDD